MTECERIVEDGLVSSSFLEEEVRDDYLVSQKSKKVWAISLDLYKRFERICMEYGLRFWVACGTMLGAVRHHGFIPWDDDFDVMMPRSDYEKLLDINPALEEPYFLQTTLTDDDYYCVYARLRNSNTTGILVSENNECNNGIYIDIIPIDGLDENQIVQQIRSMRIKISNVMAHAYMFNCKPHPISRTAHWILRKRFIPYNYKKVYKKVQANSRKVAWSETDYVGLILLLGTYSYKQSILRKEWFSDTVYIDFESIRVPVPIGYKEILTTIYGDYMQYPPVEARGTWHSFIFEPDIPYKVYMQTANQCNQVVITG